MLLEHLVTSFRNAEVGLEHLCKDNMNNYQVLVIMVSYPAITAICKFFCTKETSDQ